jgi:uncharacterized protein YndB with AHSA1/START domain
MSTAGKSATSGARSPSSSGPIERTVVHSSFCIERTYAASPAQVYHALTDPAAKAQWFGVGERLTVLARTMDVRPGGREHLQGRWGAGGHRDASDERVGPPSGVVSTFDAVYLDVIPEQRLVYAYEMHLDQRKISVSLATMELERTAAGTRLIVTEQGAFLDGYDDAGARERGTAALLDALGRALAS